MKLSKKWLMVIALVMSLTMATAGTLAYLTDRDTVENTFTVGNVDIEVEEEFEQDSPLNPGVKVDKLAGIENVHATEPAYVWMTVSVPEKLADYITLEWDGVTPEECEYTVHEGYVSYLVKHDDELAAGASTPMYLKSVTLSEKVDYQNGAYVIVEDGEIKATIGSLDDVKIIVDGFATQTEGFADVNEAYDAYTTQWVGLNGGMSTGTPVDNVEDLLAALENGTTDDIVYTGSEPVVIDEELKTAGVSKIDLGGAELKFEDGGKIMADNGIELTITDAEIVSDGSGTIFEVTNGSVVTLGEGVVIENITPEDDFSLFNMYDYNDETAKIVLAGAEITGNDNNGNGKMFNVGYGTELVIEEGTVISGNNFSGNTSNRNPYSLVTVDTKGVVTMNGGTITDNEFDNYALIYIAGGKFVLNGGEITNNEYTGSGTNSLIQVATSASSFEMTDGEISNNTLPGGYVLNAGSGTVTIAGGKVTNNTAVATGYKTFGTITVGSGATVDGSY